VRQYSAIFFILLLLVSSANITLGTHFCGGYAVDSQLMIGHQHLDCGMSGMDQMMSNADHSTQSIIKMQCCDNEYLTIITDDNFQNNTLATNFNWDFLEIPAIELSNLLLTCEDVIHFKEYNPPLIGRDLPIWHQSFLI
jgi:hypothetical protein